MKKKHVTINPSLHARLSSLADSEMTNITTCAEQILESTLDVIDRSKESGGDMNRVLGVVKRIA